MQYMIFVHAAEAGFAKLSKEEGERAMASYVAYTKTLADAKVLVNSHQLRPVAETTTLRMVDGKRRVQDGPFAETKEQLGGFYLIDVASLDEALDWAAKCPGAYHGTLEIRAIWN